MSLHGCRTTRANSARVVRFARAALVSVLACTLSVLSAQPGYAATTEKLVLIVTNNASSQLARPSLKYADDDGAKYFELFRALHGEAPTLISRFDRDTARQYPELTAHLQAPTKAAVDTAFQRFAAKAQTARSAGHEVEFYFVFAGHGDVDQGQGFLELEDGTLGSADLKAKLKSVNATRTHVILDSCNSFFVLNARKPGGVRFPTPEDAAKQLSEDLPNVGVFLSTSAEAEVFEWSELGGGIFSHVVRSGLAGAADANHDGIVSYAELRAFADIATRSVKNPRFRPTVFARGPAGNAAGALVSLHDGKAATLTFAGLGDERLTLRDSDEVPWLDMHRESNALFELVVPARLTEKATLERRVGEKVVARNTIRRLETGALELASEEAQRGSEVVAARGAQDVFRALYADSFGPNAMAAYESEIPKSPVYGASTDDEKRLALVLKQTADQERVSKNVGSIALIGLGAGTATAGVWLATRSYASADTHGETTLRFMGGTLAATGIFAAGAGIWGLATMSEAERVQQRYRDRLASGRSMAWVLHETELEMKQLTSSYATVRQFALGASILVAAASGTLLLVNEFGNGTVDTKMGNRVLGLTGLGLGAAGIYSSLQLTPIERMTKLWLEDPVRTKMQIAPSVAPIKGGASFSVTGRF